ncbi:GIY-YIG nuclease family protein [Autumnicola edwardsiae]|uniref:GIY-YIG nuclease family protein n=1 Tax=Autumnicola edwardsiae TaxID=3075594 RepID=A0ABU3CUC8_9FLAO|nr:GIY-YIG nuclease family protein [Zunongwangia sp. F297]MDT0649967.1 GIY-YIG nuclease family protein [Zunongwangia sp. F297]
MKIYFDYIMTNQYRTTFYVGVSQDLKRRISQHAGGTGSKFTSKYNLTDLIYFEEYNDVNQSILREKQLKNWKKDWKLDLIRGKNPELRTLQY